MSDLGSFVKRLRDIMRNDAGINGDAQRIEQIAWMLFLKVYDAQEENWEFDEEDYVSIIPENCRWRNWAVDDGKGTALTGDQLLAFVNNTLFPTLKNLDVIVTPMAGGKLHFKFGELRERSTNNIYIITGATLADLPDVTNGTAIDPTSGSWAGAFKLAGSDTPEDQTEYEYTLPSGHTSDTAIHIVELLRSMKPIGARKIVFTPIA